MGGTPISGRTTCLEHKKADWEKEAPKYSGEECIEKVTVLNVQWSNCPVEVQDEVRELWGNRGLSNNQYYRWHMDEEEPDWEDHGTSLEEMLEEEPDDVIDRLRYPLIEAFLHHKGCEGLVLIYWWW